MNVKLTIANRCGDLICESKLYDFHELRHHPGLSRDERRWLLDLLRGKSDAVEWRESVTTIRVQVIKETS